LFGSGCGQGALQEKTARGLGGLSLAGELLEGGLTPAEEAHGFLTGRCDKDAHVNQPEGIF